MYIGIYTDNIPVIKPRLENIYEKVYARKQVGN